MEVNRCRACGQMCQIKHVTECVNNINGLTSIISIFLHCYATVLFSNCDFTAPRMVDGMYITLARGTVLGEPLFHFASGAKTVDGIDLKQHLGRIKLHCLTVIPHNSCTNNHVYSPYFMPSTGRVVICGKNIRYDA